jgi:hypothetical protein
MLDPTVASLTASVNPASFGDAITFTVNVSLTSAGSTPNGSIALMDGTSVLGSATLNAASSASFTIATLTPGQHSLTAVYSGDANSSPATSAALLESVKQSTSITLATSSASVVAGAAVTFTATVSAPNAVPVGSVVFQDGAAAIGNGAINASGFASFSTTSLAPGLHAVTAVYSGDSGCLPSTSASVAQAVQAATSITLASSSNPASVGGATLLTASVTAAGSNASTGALSGSISFMDGSSLLGSAAVNASGIATLNIATLTLGTHAIAANYAGATYFTGSTSTPLSQVVQLAVTSTLLASSANPSILNAAVTFTASVAGSGITASGAVKFCDGSSMLGQGTLNAAGLATFTTAALAVGQHSISAAYAGDANNLAGNSAALTQIVLKATTTVSLLSTPNPSSQHVYVQFTAVVTGNGTAPTGSVVFQDGGTTLGSAAVNAGGIALWSTNSLAMGQHNMVAVYQGDAANGGSTSTQMLQNVLPASAIAIASSRNPGVAGAALTLTATVIGQSTVPTGTVTFQDGATALGTAALNTQGSATLTVSTLNVGAHSIMASYAGDAANASSSSAAFAQTIQQATTQVALTTAANPVIRGSSALLTATVTGNGGTAGGNVSLMDGMQSLGTYALNSAAVAAFATTALSVGQHNLTAVYAGDANDAGSTSNAVSLGVTQASPAIQIATSSNPSLAGSGVTLTATLKGAAETPSGTVIWLSGATVLGSSTVNASGTSSYTANGLAVGQYLISGAYSGDVNNVGATSTVMTQLVQQSTSTTVQSNANQSVSGATIHFVATVTGSSGVPATGSVTFLDGATAIGTGAVNAGIAVFDASALTTGLHTMTAVYNGDASSQTSTSAPWTQSVAAASTSVVLTSSANPSIAGNVVTLTALVSGNGVQATGTVTFLDGVAVLGSAKSSGGLAAYTTAALSAGQHILIAQYSGDNNNQSAVSVALTQTVQQQTTVVLAAGANPLLTAQSVNLTATVRNGGTSAPAGLVVFADGSTILASAALNSSGAATLTVASLCAGQHALTANYVGDTFDLPSVSAVVTETVQLRATTTSLAASAGSVASGQQLTLFADVQGNGPGTPTGTVNFFAGTSLIGSAALASTGIATLSYSPAVGTYSIAATYKGDSVYAASTAQVSSPIVVGQATEFTLTLNPAAVQVASTQSSIITITLNSVAGFSDLLEMGCLGLPTAATCTFSTDQVNLSSSGTQAVQVTLGTSSPLGAGGQARMVGTPISSLTRVCALPAGLLLALLLWCSRRKRLFLGGLVLFVLAALAIGIDGCGAMQINGTPAGTYNIMVTAVGSKTGVSQSANVTLTVTP